VYTNPNQTPQRQKHIQKHNNFKVQHFNTTNSISRHRAYINRFVPSAAASLRPLNSDRVFLLPLFTLGAHLAVGQHRVLGAQPLQPAPQTLREHSPLLAPGVGGGGVTLGLLLARQLDSRPPLPGGALTAVELERLAGGSLRTNPLGPRSDVPA